ncbi:MAG: hypothetical protein KGJ81_09415 [Alphaproteobacteria bacterium]|nr:hypothetical protein [Alphaproteobacteria bacterium]
MRDRSSGPAFCNTFSFVLLLLASVTQSLAGEQTPRAFVEWIYSHYQGGAREQQGVYLDSPAQIRRYFAPPLAKRLVFP